MHQVPCMPQVSNGLIPANFTWLFPEPKRVLQGSLSSQSGSSLIHFHSFSPAHLVSLSISYSLTHCFSQLSCRLVFLCFYHFQLPDATAHPHLTHSYSYSHFQLLLCRKRGLFLEHRWRFKDFHIVPWILSEETDCFSFCPPSLPFISFSASSRSLPVTPLCKTPLNQHTFFFSRPLCNRLSTLTPLPLSHLSPHTYTVLSFSRLGLCSS